MNLLITNGRIIDPSQRIDAKMDLLINDGVIVEVGKKVKASAATIDASNLVIVHGFIAALLDLTGIPAASEETVVARDVILARLTGAHLHIAHLSTGGAVEAVRAARKSGVHVTCEVTPHHIALADDATQTFSTNLKMNPPLRSEEHRKAVIEAIADGTIDAIATDHAPHHFDEKNVEFDLAPFGVIGLETAFAICYDRLVRRKIIDLSRLVDLMSCSPAR